MIAATFDGQKWTRDETAANAFCLNRVDGVGGSGLCKDEGRVNLGGNSGYQAVNLAYHLGARKIILLGFDMHRKHGGHWHGEHDGMLSAPANHIAKWRRMFEAMAIDLKKSRVRVVNATVGSALDCFQKMSLNEALRR